MGQMLTPDYSEAFKPIDAGKYEVRVSGFDLKKSKQTDARYVAWVLELLDGGHEGAKIRFNTMLEGKGAGILKHFLKCCDGAYEDGAFDPDTYIGARLGAEIVHEEYNGKVSPKVKDVFALDFGTREDTPF